MPVRALPGGPTLSLTCLRGAICMDLAPLQHTNQKITQHKNSSYCDKTTISSVQGLAGLFQAPADLLHQGTFDEAREEAQEKQLWLVSGVVLFDRLQPGV